MPTPVPSPKAPHPNGGRASGRLSRTRRWLGYLPRLILGLFLYSVAVEPELVFRHDHAFEPGPDGVGLTSLSS